MAAVRPVPEGYPTVSPYLVVDGAGAAIEFYAKVLGTTERMRLPGPDGTIGHAELQLGDSLLMVADEAPQLGIRGPRAIGGTPVTISVSSLRARRPRRGWRRSSGAPARGRPRRRLTGPPSAAELVDLVLEQGPGRGQLVGLATQERLGEALGLLELDLAGERGLVGG